MKETKFKRVFALIAAALMIVAFGCGKAALNESAAQAVSPENAIMGGDSESGATGGTEYLSGYTVDGTTEESTDGSFASNAANGNAILVKNAGVFSATSVDINKNGDAEGDFSSGNNAAIAVLSQGQMTLNESNVTTNATGGFGLFVSGEGSLLTLNGSSIYTAVDSSPALVIANGATAVMTGGGLSTEGNDSPCVLLSGGSITLKGVALSALIGEQMRVLSGTNELTLDGTAMSATPIVAEEATLQLNLLNGAAFTGELGSMLPARASVSLDATSKLILSADTYLTGFVNADTTHQNIESNGFYLYYDSNAPENAYLNGQSYMLPGGGFLAPII